MRRRAGHFVAGITSLFVALCTTCGVAPGFVLSQALGANALAAAAPMCSRTGDCGSSCPTEKESRPGDCRSCSTSPCGFVVSERETPSRPRTDAAGLGSARVAIHLSATAASARSASLAASPPLNVLLRTFRN